MPLHAYVARSLCVYVVWGGVTRRRGCGVGAEMTPQQTQQTAISAKCPPPLAAQLMARERTCIIPPFSVHYDTTAGGPHRF